MRGLLLALLVAVIFNVVTSQILKVGFAYTSPREDVSWTYAIENARQQIENDYPEVFTEWTVITVPASQTCPSTCLNDIRAFVSTHQFDLVVLAGQAFYDVDHIVAGEFNNTRFAQISRGPLVPHAHVAWFSAFIEQVRFLSGVTAGLMTNNDEVGYVTVNRLQPVLRQFNAWYFGVKKVKPNAKVYLISGNSFGNATADRIAAEHILNISNVDVLSFQKVSRVACERGLYSTGYGSDIRKFVGDSVLTSAMWNWVPALHYFIDKIAENRWDNTTYDGTITTNSIRLAEFSPVVPQSVVDTVNSLRQQVIDGTELMFCGPQVPHLSNGAATGCMTRAQQNLVNKVPSSIIDPNFFDLGNVDLSLPASEPKPGCWSPVVVVDPPKKVCTKAVEIQQTLENSYTVNGESFSQWKVSVSSSNSLYLSFEFDVVPQSGYQYIVSSASQAEIKIKNITCEADCSLSAEFKLRSSWTSGGNINQIFDITVTNNGYAVADSSKKDITIYFENGSYPTGQWNLATSSTTADITSNGYAFFSLSSYYLQPRSSFSGAGFILTTPGNTAPNTLPFQFNSYSCK